jgi:hypothetical protein
MFDMTVRPTHASKLLRSATPGAFGYGAKQIIGVCLFSGLIAGAFSVLTSEGVASNAPASAFSVNRLNKADRLASSLEKQLSRHDSSLPASALRALEPIPYGCELAFSELLHPADENFVRDCLT